MEQVVLKNAIYLTGKKEEVTRQLRALLAMYGDISLADLLKLLQQ